jgi:hypothetical protein
VQCLLRDVLPEMNARSQEPSQNQQLCLIWADRPASQVPKEDWASLRKCAGPSHSILWIDTSPPQPAVEAHKAGDCAQESTQACEGCTTAALKVGLESVFEHACVILPGGWCQLSPDSMQQARDPPVSEMVA